MSTKGNVAGYAKFETFPFNLSLKHPVNLAYEAATAIWDVNMIDPFHLMLTVNLPSTITGTWKFSRFKTILQKISGKDDICLPTDMESTWSVTA